MTRCCLETKCIQCCLETNMLLSYRDIEIIEKLGHQKDFFVVEKEGWLQLRNHHGRCVFHNGNKCTIYNHRPEGCSLYPIVYDKTNKQAILDDECPQKTLFSLPKTKQEQLRTLVRLLQKERTQRLRRKITRKVPESEDNYL